MTMIDHAPDATYVARVADAVAAVRHEWSELADPATAEAMAAYMKSDMPFYGIKAPVRKPTARRVRDALRPTTDAEYVHLVRNFWRLPHREEKYLAIGLAGDYRGFITSRHLGLYRDLIVDGAWWDFVDPVAAKCVGRTLLHERSVVAPVMDKWIAGDDMWLRRSALLAHLGHKSATDAVTLFEHCLRLAHEQEFFIRKAIGWVLREYAKTDPSAVTEFVLAHRDRLSGLTFREATKHLAVT
jgi:3-methyladenine DNA glycosylase AlkD